MRDACTHKRDDRSPVTPYAQVLPRPGGKRVPLYIRPLSAGRVLATWSLDTCCGARP